MRITFPGRAFALAAGLLLCAAIPAAAAPEPLGWYAGDPHVHRSCGGAPESVTSLRTKMSTNNLRVMSLLADMGNGEVQNPTTDLPLVTGADASQSTSSRMIHWDTEWHWDATYGQFAHQVLGGHLVALGLSRAQQVWEEYTARIFDWAHTNNAQVGAPPPVVGFAHMQYLDDGIPQSLNCCIPIEYPVEVALQPRPPAVPPQVGGNRVTPFISQDVTGSNSAVTAYYRLLNTGFRPGLAAGTDYPCGVSTLGSLLTYVQVDGGLSYRKWIEGIRDGRTVVSRNGRKEFLDLKVNSVASPGDQLSFTGGGTVPVSMTWTATQRITGGRIELVQNGAVVAARSGTVTATTPLTLTANVNFSKSGWLAARRMDGAGEHRLHTGAIFVTVDGKAVRASAEDANFYVRWMNTLLARTTLGGSWDLFETPAAREAARRRYSEARTIYHDICVEAGGSSCDGGSGGGGGGGVDGTIFGTTTPSTIIENDPSAVELGVKFKTTVPGYITALRFYKGPQNTGTHVGSLWTASGERLASPTFTNETASGWQQINLATPVAIQANITYIASYHTNVGFYSVNEGFFASDVTSGNLRALADGDDGGNGVYRYGASAFPSDTWNASNYWVDVVFKTTVP